MISRSPFFRPVLLAVVLLGVLAGLRFLLRPRESVHAKEVLKVGYLPVNCHLTCPVTDFATRTSTRTRFESQRFTDFPSAAEAFKSGRLEASFFIAPLAMKLREQGVPAKIVYLGHRDGSTLIVQKDGPVHSLEDLKGKVFAIPSKYSNQYLVLRKLLEYKGVSPDSLRFVELAPPEMPAALAAKAIDAYFVGEPHAAKAELAGTGRVLYHAKDIWPHFISCDLVRGISESGEWAETHRLEAARLVAPYFRQDEGLLRFVLTQPPNRVSYRMLTPTDEEMQAIEEMALKAGILSKPILISDLLDRSFIPSEILPAKF